MNSLTNQGGFGAKWAMSMLTALFFIWGFITCLNDILIPHLKAVFELSYAQVMLIQFCFFAAYFLVSLPSGYLVDRIGYQRGIVIGLLVAGMGCFLFYPAAELRLFSLFLAAIFVLAAGITLLQVSANPYVALLGDAKTASSRLTLTQAFNSLGTTLAPYFGAFFILAAELKTPETISRLDADSLSRYRSAEAAAVQMPYLLLAIALLLTAVIFFFLKLPAIEPVQAVEGMLESTNNENKQRTAWHFPNLVLGAIAIFLYVGAEVAIGSFLVSFLTEPAISRMNAVEAARLVPFYWGGAMVGRFVGAAVMRRIKPGKVLGFNALSAGLLVGATLASHGQTAIVTLLAVGLFNSIMFPTIFSLALKGLGKHTGQGSGILCCAIVGGAIIPLLQGWVADRLGVQPAFFIPLLCYFYIAYYGFRDAGISSEG